MGCTTQINTDKALNRDYLILAPKCLCKPTDKTCISSLIYLSFEEWKRSCMNYDQRFIKMLFNMWSF